MWLFLSGGLLMPATFPKSKVDKKFVPEDSDFDIQVRGRVVSHLENFIRDYMEPNGYAVSEIQVTPNMDYNCRFYTRRQDFAIAVGMAVLDIDFEKFKPTAERKDANGVALYKDGSAYHSVLNSIWGTVTSLGRPGGKWDKPFMGGAYSGRSAHVKGYSGNSAGFKRDDAAYDWDNYSTPGLFSDLDVPAWKASTRDFNGWTPRADERVSEIYLEMEGIPREQYIDFLTDDEMILIQNFEKEQHEFEALAMRDPEPSQPARTGHGRRSKSKKDKRGRRFYTKK
jgi:hypothetical protein